MSNQPSTSSKQNDEEGDNTDSAGPECSVCLQPSVYPLSLPQCGHIFCFLCIKGVAYQSLRCPMCRKPFEAQIFRNPDKLVTLTAPENSLDSESATANRWYYKGNAGWWAYDERSTADIEAAYTSESESVEMLIAGKIYVIDFASMTQYQKRDPRRKREIKRDVAAAPIKGVAGLRVGATESSSVVEALSKLTIKAEEESE